ncbi:hypothetical protein P5V15_008391 [Pogonomyrmex californicus]
MFRDVCILLKITKIQTTAYHPESNRALERSHRTLIEYLRHVYKRALNFDRLFLPDDWVLRNDPTVATRNVVRVVSGIDQGVGGKEALTTLFTTQ